MTIQVESPSNIALVKYWGKHGIQLPLNPSISFTLSKAKTITRLEWEPGDSFELIFLFDGQRKAEFEPKLHSFFQRISALAPEIVKGHFLIDSKNTFPHSSGIASSASAFSALAIGIAAILQQIRGEESLSLQMASEMARLGSGSAARSVFAHASVWGRHESIRGSADEYGIGVGEELHPLFRNYRDTVLLIDSGTKSVSSTAGHALMNGHVFGKARIDQGFRNCSRMLQILRSGDIDAFIPLLEQEALTLHALMMSADQPYLLMRPGTVATIEAIRSYRSETGIPVSFTLDAGANVHLLFPEHEEQKVNKWVDEVLIEHCANGYLCDVVGEGPQWKANP